MSFKGLKNLEVKNKITLVRAGFDVAGQGEMISDDYRIKSAVPSINWLVKNKAKVLILTHRGRPREEGEIWTKRFSLLPAVERLGKMLNRKVIVLNEDSLRLPEYQTPHIFFFSQNIEKTDIRKLIDLMEPGDIGVLENLRFYQGEEEKDQKFAEKLASIGECYVNEAFSNSHRDHASMTLLPKILPSAGGLALEKEINGLSRVLRHPASPFVLIMGGLKLRTKAPALTNLAHRADAVLLGGGLANLFLSASGRRIGKSICDTSQERLARKILRDYREKIYLPVDLVVSDSREGRPMVVSNTEVGHQQMILDIGPETILAYSQIIKSAKTLVWNGPMGYYEQPSFSHGTKALAYLFASRSGGAAFGIAGGGETLDAIFRSGLAQHIDLISTGGGAMLEYLAGKPLIALEAL